MLKKDVWMMGMAIGLFQPLMVYLLALLLLSFTGRVEGWMYTPLPSAPMWLAIASNLLSFRYYMVNLKYDRTGRGLLLLTFVWIILYFALM